MIKRKEVYKYLGVQVSLGKAHAMFKVANKKKICQLNSIMGQILALAKNSYEPITVGLALWNSCAIPALLHGIEIISLNKKDIDDLETLQCQFGAALLGVPISTAHCGVRRELGLVPIKILIYKRKLLYMRRIANLDDDIWVKQAYLECQLAKGKSVTHELAHLHINNNNLKGQWLSSWGNEISKIIKDIENTTGNSIDTTLKPKNIVKVINKFLFLSENNARDLCKEKSLKWLPYYPLTRNPQTYLLLENEEAKEALAKFRLGNAGLGNRREIKITICPACKNGPNSESHLILQCMAPDIVSIKEQVNMCTVMETFKQAISNSNIDEQLTTFLEGLSDTKYSKGYSLMDILYARGNYLSIILKYFK